MVSPNIVTQKNASMLRRYFIEYTVLFLTMAVIVLFYMFVNLNNKVVQLQSDVIEKNTQSNIELKNELSNFKNFSR